MSQPKWTVREMAGGVDVLDEQGREVALMNTGTAEGDRVAAEQIAHAVNFHREAVKALERAVQRQAGAP